ncbi:hypothetical protein LMG31886_38490 [Xanthomonas hydrangeae]|nr:hypothetical protein LMG31885_21900 [Xanthomonas hydrangeae]CAD7734725.1 hypothetical protein LMG31885_21900 [Xanthomonas hydrangeae]CAD7745201.1 hypothetical protein LMG31886_38490 [Xanthomonas hydrangeae]CAD7745204.1 hypothetical protein LMG31886_38490 [Xanthomonas hydrangeae]
MATRDVVFPQGRHALYERHRYSPAVRAEGLLLVAGQVGSREDGSPEPELAAEIARAFHRSARASPWRCVHHTQPRFQ